jgi:hypothetical protein
VRQGAAEPVKLPDDENVAGAQVSKAAFTGGLPSKERQDAIHRLVGRWIRKPRKPR